MSRSNADGKSYQKVREELIDLCEKEAREQHKRDGGTDGDGGLLTRDEIAEEIDNPYVAPG